MPLTRTVVLVVTMLACGLRGVWAQDADLLPEITTEDELYEYWADGDIDDATLMRLLERFDAVTRPEVAGGRLRLRSQVIPGEHRFPAMVLQGDGRYSDSMETGLSLMLQRERPDRVAYDPLRNALAAAPPEPQVRLPKGYLVGQKNAWEVIAGTYRIGFGLRLTFDNTGQAMPDGILPDNGIIRGSDLKLACREASGELPYNPCYGGAGSLRMSPDYTWQSSLLGAAMGWRQVFSAGELVGYGFGSYQPLSLSQYALLDANACVNPLDPSDPACDAPEVYVHHANTLTESAVYRSQVLPHIVNEALGGVYLGFQHKRRWRLGVLGWGAKPVWRPEGIALDFQPWTRQPYGGGYGAVGAHAGWGFNRVAFDIELARSFDHMPGGGGYGGLVQQKTNWEQHSLELSLRWYGQDYANPYARPIAGADQRDGNRARDERGGRMTYAGRLGSMQLQALADVWQTIRDRDIRLRTHLRGDWVGDHAVRPGLWLAYRRDGYRADVHSACPVSSPEDQGCSESQVRVTPRLRVVPGPSGSLLLQYQHTWLDGSPMAESKRQDLAVSLYANWQPVSWLDLRGRAKYVYQDKADPARLPRTLHSFIAAAYRWATDRGPRMSVETRYDHRLWLDRRESTLARIPNPEHWLRLDMRVGF